MIKKPERRFSLPTLSSEKDVIVNGDEKKRKQTTTVDEQKTRPPLLHSSSYKKPDEKKLTRQRRLSMYSQVSDKWWSEQPEGWKHDLWIPRARDKKSWIWAIYNNILEAFLSIAGESFPKINELEWKWFKGDRSVYKWHLRVVARHFDILYTTWRLT